jgi:glycosyltransferase involved in cell wall biosynthesis
LEPDETVIGTVARLDAVKNQAMMIRATRSMRDQNHKVRLLPVGDGLERDALHALTADLELEASVIFTGFQSQPADYLSLMDVFLLPSFTQGLDDTS